MMELKIKALIIDDEIGSREVLRKLLTKYHPEIEISDEASNAADAYELVKTLDPQLVFLDIRMPRADGFSFLKKFDKVPFEIIFVTSFDQYAINAIKFSALDYLLKPVSVSELKQAIAKALQHIEKKTNQQIQVINLLDNLTGLVTEKRFAVHTGDLVKLLSVSDIVYIEADRRYCQLYMTDHKRYTVARSLTDFENYLKENASFIRISKSFLLNINYIQQYSKGDPVMLTLKTGKVVEIPRRKKPNILERLKGIG